MAHLTLAGLTGDGARLVLVDDHGTEHTLDISPGLRSVLRGDATRLGQLEITMDSALRPRDIQARIRAGESPEEVAEAARTTVERIMPFAGPVLAEREHVAGRAQASTVRRRSGEGAGARTLGEAVAAHLRARNVDPDDVAWDAWRREDGRWALVGGFEAGDRSGTAELTFDVRGNYVLLDNDDARWLVGESLGGTSEASASDDLSAARLRRAGLAGQGGVLGDDALDLVSEPDTGDLHQDTPVEAFLTTAPPADEVGDAARAQDATARAEAADAAATDDAGRDPSAPAGAPVSDPYGSDAEEQEPEPTPPPRRSVAKKRGRASVPTWDEIMFGGNDS